MFERESQRVSKMGKKSKKNKKSGKGGESTEYDAATQHMIHVGQRSPTHELHESEYFRLDDKIDEKEKAKLRRQASRRKADSEAEDYDEKKEKRKAVEKAKQKKKVAEEKAIKKKQAVLAEIEGTKTTPPVKQVVAAEPAAPEVGEVKKKKKKKKRGRGRDDEESSTRPAAGSVAVEKVEMQKVELAGATNLTNE